MVCTKCGAELKDGDLFCLSCGQEVQIVPDYNPVEEIVVMNLVEAQQIDDKIDDENTEDSSKSPKDEKIQDINENLNKSKIKSVKKAISRKAILGILTAVIIVTAAFLVIRHRNSFEYQYTKAIDCINLGDYEEAYKYLEKALIIDDKNLAARFLMKDVYLNEGNIDDAILILNEIIALDPDNLDAGKELLMLYTSNNYADQLETFFAKIRGSELFSKLQLYYIEQPVFSIEEGTYDQYLSLEITASSGCDIYYTVDDTKPTANAIKYSGQIRLRGGSTKIRAVAVNNSGIVSLETSKQYTVNSTVPDNPVIVPASGQYNVPMAISVNVPSGCEVYYTLNGTEPTENSYHYTRPIDMPIGQSTLSVVAINESGVVSNTITSNYNLQFDVSFDIEQAYNIIAQKLEFQFADARGSYTLECCSAIEIGGYNLYVFEKVYGIDQNGNKIYGADKFAFDVLTAETFTAVVNAANGYDLTPF